MTLEKIIAKWVSAVTDSNRIEVRSREEGKNIVVEVAVDKPYMGTVIGKGGKYVKAWSFLLNYHGKKEKKVYKVKVIDLG